MLLLLHLKWKAREEFIVQEMCFFDCAFKKCFHLKVRLQAIIYSCY